ncbi:hypothetical protein T484DRAFT_1889700, partial [Baffinella frigidus]
MGGHWNWSSSAAVALRSAVASLSMLAPPPSGASRARTRGRSSTGVAPSYHTEPAAGSGETSSFPTGGFGGAGTSAVAGGDEVLNPLALHPVREVSAGGGGGGGGG